MSSILTDTKKVLSLSEDYTAFDQDIIIFINSAFSVLNQLGVGPDEGLTISDDSDDWGALGVEEKVTNLVKTYLYLKVRMLFDPPTMSFMIEAMDKQLKEYEWRLSHYHELTL